MNWKKLTYYFMGIVAVIMGAWDVLVLVKGGTEASISHTVIAWSYRYPIFTFLSGILCGHFFWRVRQTKELKNTVPQIKDK
jgi:hypothetical protein